MILDDIKVKLEQIDERVFYGMVDNKVKETIWNYIVFNRVKFKTSQNKTGYSYYYDVHIVRENFIPEDLELEVINKILEISGMRLTEDDFNYEYVEKPNTNIVIEMLSIRFVRAKKC